MIWQSAVLSKRPGSSSSTRTAAGPECGYENGTKKELDLGTNSAGENPTLSIRGVVPEFMGMKNATRGREAHTRNGCGLIPLINPYFKGKQSHRDQSRAFKLHTRVLADGRAAVRMYCARETRFCGAETKAPKRHVKSNRQLAETKCAHESPPVRGYSQRAGKSLFARDCVVGLGGLELLTKRLLPRHE